MRAFLLSRGAGLSRRRLPRAAADGYGASMSDTAPLLRLNPSLDLGRYVDMYRRNGIVQIPDVFEADTAKAIEEMLRNTMPWRLLFTDENDQPVHFSRDEQQQIGREKLNAMLQQAHRRARENRGYFYFTYPMIEAYLRGWDSGHPVHAVTELINSESVLGLARIVLGTEGITKADAHATCYGPGHFLTRHLDLGSDLERRAAYVLGFTKNWQPDWGGLLLFLSDQQDITRGYLPRFNNLTIFDTKYLHTVTQVSNFAGGLRLSITGWFRDDAVARAASGPRDPAH